MPKSLWNSKNKANLLLRSVPDLLTINNIVQRQNAHNRVKYISLSDHSCKAAFINLNLESHALYYRN